MKSRTKILIPIFLSILIIFTAFLIYYFANPLANLNTAQPIEKSTLLTTKLDNDLTITIKEMHQLPLVTVQFWIKTGSRNENDHNRGVSHIFEHIFFKGTKTQPPGTFLSRVENLGGEFNAMTSMDWTVFFITIPSDKFDFILPYFTDLLLNPEFNQEEIDKELKVILEEQSIDFNEPLRYATAEFGKILIDEHPYKHPIIGYENTIANMSRENILSFYHAWYVPNNINIIVVGDVKTEHVLEKVKEELKDFKKRPIPKLNLPKQKLHTVQRYNISERAIGYDYIVLGYILPPADSKEIYTFDVLSKLLVEAKSSRLEKILKNEKNLVDDDMGGVFHFKDMSMFEIILTVDPEKKSEALGETLILINDLKNELVSSDELKTGKMLLKSDRAKKLEEVYAVGIEIGEMWAVDILDKYYDYISNIDKVSKKDIQNAARGYFLAPVIFEVKPK